MNAGATLDITSYLNAVDNASDTSSNKSNANKSNEFENVFENVNKSYNADSSTPKTVQDKKETVHTTKQKISEKDYEKTSKDENEENTISSQNTNKEESNSIENPTDRSDDTNNNGTAQITNDEQEQIGQNNQTQQDNVSENLTPQEIDLAQQALLALESAAVETPQQQATEGNLNANQPISQAATANNNINPAQLGLGVAAESQLAGVQENILNGQQAPIVQNNTNMDPAQIAQNTKDMVTAQANNAKVGTQPQTQNTEQANNAAQQQPNQALVQDAKIQTPIIEANVEIIASNSNLNIATNETDAAKNANNILNKTALTQEMIDKTNAKVVSVKNSDASDFSNSNNLLNKQNAGEQAIKLTLQSEGPKIKEADLSGVSNTATQSEFVKTLDNAQTQAPKEISKTEVLSQVYNKLDSLKQEGTTKVSIILKPENLGKITVELMNGKDGLVAKMTTDNAQVKEILDKSLNGLKDTLSNQGVNVNNVTVKISEAQKQDTMFSFDGQSHQGNEQFSENPKNTSQNKFSFDNTNENLTETVESDLEKNDSVTLNTHEGQVDYKV